MFHIDDLPHSHMVMKLIAGNRNNGCFTHKFPISKAKDGLGDQSDLSLMCACTVHILYIYIHISNKM